MLLTLASIVIVIAGLKAAGKLAVLLIFSMMFAVLLQPAVRHLRNLGAPNLLAVSAVVLSASALVYVIISIVVVSLGQFSQRIPDYINELSTMMTGLADSIRIPGTDFELDPAHLTESIDTGKFMGAVGTAVGSAVGFLTNFLVVAATTIFMLFEGAALPAKLRAAFGHNTGPGRQLRVAVNQVQRYLVIKTVVSLITGILVGIWCKIFGLNYPALWAMIAFLMNFIPSVGSILAAIPAVLLALVELGGPGALVITIGYAAVNVVMGNVIEPKVMGDGLGISPLVVFVSLIVWGWIWGPAGMLLAVPMTVMIKLILEADEVTRPYAVFLGGTPENAGLRESPLIEDPSAAEPSENTFEGGENRSLGTRTE